MEWLCRVAKKTIFCQNFRDVSSSHHQWLRMRESREKEKWHHWGLTHYQEHCTHSLNKENYTPGNKMQGKHKKQLAYDLKIQEALEIRRHNAGPGKGLNEDMGAYVKTDMWDPVLSSIGVTWFWIIGGGEDHPSLGHSIVYSMIEFLLTLPLSSSSSSPSPSSRLSLFLCSLSFLATDDEMKKHLENFGKKLSFLQLCTVTP